MSRFKSHIVKKILGALIIVGCSGVFLNGYVGTNEAYAQSGTNTAAITNSGAADTGDDAGTSMGLREILNLFLKLIYLLLRPLLVVAGLSLDNTLVYASVFHLDAPLWKFRNMIKNFANFTLGFMVLFAIIKSILSGSGEGSIKDDKTPLGIIKKTLIAGVLIQASRFLMAALIDISTVATYAVGGLPLTVLKNTDIGSQRILMVNSQMNLDQFNVFSEEGEGFKVRYSVNYKKPDGSTTEIDISPCRVKNDYIIGREFGDEEFRHPTEFAGTAFAGLEVCIVFHNQLAMRNEAAFMQKIMDTGAMANLTATGKVYTGHNAYKAVMKNLTRISGRQEIDFVKQYAINLNSGNTAPGIVTGKNFYGNTTSMTISDLINKSKGFVGPLVTMYSSLLNFAQLTDTKATTLGETSGIFLIKALVAIALFFPLLALAVVLVARIALLRLYIAGSPFLIIKNVFDKLIPKEALGKLDKHLDLGNVLKLIFAPVVTVAALSISLIFMTALINAFKSEDNQQLSSQIASDLSITQLTGTSNTAKYQFANSVNVEFKNFDRGGSLDRFSWLVVNFFAIGILWTILFAAIKANALGEKIGGEIQTFGANLFQTLPIIPFGKDGERVGLGSAYRELKQVPTTRVEDRETEQREKVRKYIEGEGGKPTFSSEQAKAMVNAGGDINAKIAAAKLKAPDNVADRGSDENRATLYKTIEELYPGAMTTEKGKVIQEFASMFNNNSKRFEEEGLKQIDANFTAKIINKITNTDDQASIEALISNTNNKPYADAYFEKYQTKTSFETKIDNKTITITPTRSGGNITYAVTVTPTS